LEGFLGQKRRLRGPWQAFERAIARLFVHKGFKNVDLVGGVNDKGADVICSTDKLDYIIQVKFSKGHEEKKEIVYDVQRAMDYYDIENGICISNKVLSSGQLKKLDKAKKSGYNITASTAGTLTDEFKKLHDFAVEPYNPRPYQITAIDSLINSYDSGDSKGLVCLATGLGKTYVTGKFLKHLYEKHEDFNVLILAHTVPLLEQFDEAIWKFLPKFVSTHLLNEQEKPSYSDGILFSTFQSMITFVKKKDLYFDLVIVDEAHHAAAYTFKRLLDAISPKYKLGLTATPFRMDKQSITPIFGEPLINYDIYDGLKNGYLSEVNYILKNDNIDVNWISENSKKGYTVKQLNKKVFIDQRDKALCNDILDQWNFYKRKRGILFCNSVPHALKIEKLMRSDFGISIASITARIERREIAKRMNYFRKGKLQMVTVFDMFNEGIDVPDVDFISFMRVTHSRTYFLQQLGRGLRFKEGKKLLVLDYVADIRRIGAVKKIESEINFKDRGSENLELDKGFEVAFSNESTAHFLDLVTRDKSENLAEYSEKDKIIIK